MADGSLTFDTKIESESFNKGMNDLNKSAKSGLDKMTSNASGQLKSLSTMAKVAIAGAVTAVVKGVADYIDDSIGLASDLIEVQNVVSTTFQENTEAVNTWAKAAKEAYGMSELKAKKYNSTMGAMLKSMGLSSDNVLDMSEGIAGLAGDMASFYNLDHDTAFEKLRAGISGETEPLKQLGINMSVANLEAYALSQGIMTAYSEMTQAEQVQLRYNYLMQVTADAQGDFAKTSDGLANKQKVLNTSLEELSATVGGVFYSAKVKAVTFLNSMAEAANSALTAIIGAFSKPTDELTPEIQAAIDKLGSIKTEIDTIKNNYALTTLNIKIKYEKSTTLAADLDTLLKQTNLTQEQVARMQEVSAALVDLYPGLRSFLGPDGIIHAEAKELNDIVGKYGALSGDGKQLLEELRTIQAGATLTTDEVSRMQTISQLLVGLYPELAKYMGEKGVINAEAAQLDGIAGKYGTLSSEAQGLLNELKAIQDGTKLTAEDADRMREISSALVALYPELKGYMGANGIISAEASVLDTIVGKYGTLSSDGQKLLEELKAVEGGATLTTEQVSQMQTVSQQLVEMYPQLDDYMGADGIIHVEAGEVSNLIEQYAKLEKAAAFSKLLAGLKEQRVQADIQLEILKKQQEMAIGMRDAALEKGKAYADFMKLFEGLEANDQAVYTYVDALHGYVGLMTQLAEKAGALDENFNAFADIDTSKIEGFSELFDWEGKIKSADEISASKTALQALFQLIQAIADEALAQEDALDYATAAAEENIKATTEAVEEGQKLLDQTTATEQAATAAFEEGYGALVEYEAKLKSVGDTLDKTNTKLEGGLSRIGYGITDAENAAAAAEQATEKQQAAIDKNAELADLTAAIAANIETASKAGTDAVEALTAAKETIATDAQAAVDNLEALTTSLGLYVTAMKDNLVAIIADAETEAADAAEAFAQGQSDGYKRQPYLRDAVRAGMIQALATAQSYLNAFYNAGYGMAANMADGVRNGGGVLSSAVSAIIRSALSVARTGTSTAYSGSISGSYATGLYRVPFNGFVMETHKNERLLTAQEAQYVPRDVTTIGQASPVIDIEALAAALKSDGSSISVTVMLDGETVADVMEPKISELQGRRFNVKGW